MPEPSDECRSTGHRVATALVGAMLVAVAATVWLIDAPIGIGQMLAALAIALLGIEACIAAWLGRRSLIGRIGPLP